MIFIINHEERLTIETLEAFLKDKEARIELSVETKKAIIECRNYLDAKMSNNKLPIYGINTGFGSLCNVIIPDSDLEQLQENLVKSHACGMGNEVEQDIVKLILFLKIQSLAYGKSGVQLETVQRLCDFVNHQIYPVVYEQGSLGASGDLSPLAHLCLPILGLGDIFDTRLKCTET